MFTTSGVARPSWLPGLSEILPGQTSCQLDVSVMWHRKILEYFQQESGDTKGTDELTPSVMLFCAWTQPSMRPTIWCMHSPHS